jgi:hypothetical protein
MDMRTQISGDGLHRLHVLKTDPGPFEAILEGKKRFEFRLDDRDFWLGDSLKLVEFDGTSGRLTGRFCFVNVLYIVKGRYGVPDSHCVMSISEPTALENQVMAYSRAEGLI